METRRYTLQDVEQSNFYQMPKFLFAGEYKKLSNDAKVLYTLLRDRHNLSISNGWFNDEKQVYLIYTREEMADMLGCSLPTVRKAVKQLTEFKLIEEERQGLNKPNLIYLSYVSIDIARTEKSFQSRQKNSFSQDGKNLSCNKTNINKTNINNNLHCLSDNDKVEDENIKNYINTYLEVRSRYRTKQHKRVSDKSLNYIDEVLSNIISNGTDLIEFKEIVDEYFQQLNNDNDGDVVCFLKASQTRYFDLGYNEVIL